MLFDCRFVLHPRLRRFTRILLLPLPTCVCVRTRPALFPGGRYADYDDTAFAPGDRDSGGWGKPPVDDESPQLGAVVGSSSGTPETTDL